MERNVWNNNNNNGNNNNNNNPFHVKSSIKSFTSEKQHQRNCSCVRLSTLYFLPLFSYFLYIHIYVIYVAFKSTKMNQRCLWGTGSVFCFTGFFSLWKISVLVFFMMMSFTRKIIFTCNLVLSASFAIKGRQKREHFQKIALGASLFYLMNYFHCCLPTRQNNRD